MPDQLTPVQTEYRRRQFRILRVVLFFVLVPFVLEAILVYAAAPPLLSSIGMAALVVGMIISIAYVWRFQECPVCRFKLWGAGTLGGQCLRCKTQLYIPRRSKGGRIYP